MNTDISYCSNKDCTVRDSCLRSDIPKSNPITITLFYPDYDEHNNFMDCQGFKAKPDKEQIEKIKPYKL